MKRLNSHDFIPYSDNSTRSSLEEVTSNIQEQIHEIIHELLITSNDLQYIMTIYKFHKKKYRSISNVFGFIYNNLATLITITIMALLEEVKQ